MDKLREVGSANVDGGDIWQMRIYMWYVTYNRFINIVTNCGVNFSKLKKMILYIIPYGHRELSGSQTHFDQKEA